MVSPNDAQRETLQHVYRYGLTLPELFHASGGLVEAPLEECTSHLDELCKHGFLATAELYPGYRTEHYYHLAAAGAELLGLNPKAAGPLPRLARIKCYAVLAFCTQGKVARTKLARTEFREQFSELWYDGQPTDYFTEALDDGQILLGYPRVDLASHGQWQRILDYCKRFYDKRTSFEQTKPKYHRFVRSWNERAADGLFRIAILTAHQDKVRRLWDAIKERQLKGEQLPPTRVYFVPGLFDVMYPRPSR